MRISATVITKNEEGNIERCLSALDFVDEIVVVDAESSDRTVELAGKFTERVYINLWPGHIQQKNHAIELAQGEWILSVDADEVITPELKQEILAAKKNHDQAIDGYHIPRRSNFIGRWITHCGWSPDYHLRLFLKSKGRFGGMNPHDIVVLKGTTAYFRQPMLHYTYPSLEIYLSRLNSYTTIAAKELKTRNKRFRLRHIILSPLATFLKMYILKAGFMDGWEGFMLCVLSSYYVLVKYLKLWELNLQEVMSEN
ncbi:MAG: glycosyltransferase family 2 protein [Candidatus Edwardsbacteria bacterium]|nr:glycosyltransferase family 2 protein [Candidatus Edwardsbacteria bacterium]MBU1576865.1 glycosyltransferase family 2 protein [Candidatus Edwardsbacteria bacterium]MBU2462494.1 glycosyltransferase family 2 protein [Candidatus Edwardsbacteria bacterium]MBU2593471.1 glycosyltransferase family 2 protein [Candidatus Edwardsbacteria bacterium]